MKRMLLTVGISLLTFVGEGFGSQQTARTAVSSPERLSSVTGLKVLREGGSAADAAVAMAFTLSVLRPDVAGLGGGGTALYFDASRGEVWALDFRAGIPNPAYVEGDLPKTGEKLAVPGFAAGLAELHRKFGERDWRDLLGPAIGLAKEGPPARHPGAADGGVTPDWLRDGLPAETLASILERVASRRAADVYEGEIARQLVARAREAGGALTLRALAEYEPRWRSPIRVDFRGDQIFTLPYPTGAGASMIEMVSVLSGFDWASISGSAPAVTHLFVEAERYGTSVAQSLSTERGSVTRPAGSAPRQLDEIRRKIESGTLDLTSKLTPQDAASLIVVDEAGNLAVLTLSLGTAFGSKVAVDDAFFIASEPTPGAYSQSLPLIVLRNGEPSLAMAVSGSEKEAMLGASIYLRHRLLGLDPQRLIEDARFVPAEDVHTVICEKRAGAAAAESLNALGHGVEWSDDLGLVHLISFGDSILAASDPRGGTSGGY